MILFGIPEEKDEQATGAWDDDGIVQRALRVLRPRFPELVLTTDVCLCEYTSHGHCGVIVDGEVHNDLSLELLARTAVSYVEAGADVVTPIVRLALPADRPGASVNSGSLPTAIGVEPGCARTPGPRSSREGGD